MSSILNSISSGDLQVQQAPKEKPVKEDSIIELLQSSEIEFETCPKLEENIKLSEIEFDISFDAQIKTEELKETFNTGFDETEELLTNPNTEFENSTNIENFNTGFGEDNDLHYETKCKPDLKTPLYQENYLKEFKTEEEKAAARHALGLYNKGDIVAMSILTAEDELPSQQQWLDATIKQLRKGDKFFTPVTQFKAVYDSKGVTLDHTIEDIRSLIITQQKEIVKINSVSKEVAITSLGDVKLFLQGFNNGDNLYNTIDTMNQEMLRFEKTGQIDK